MHQLTLHDGRCYNTSNIVSRVGSEHLAQTLSASPPVYCEALIVLVRWFLSMSDHVNSRGTSGRRHGKRVEEQKR